MYSYDGPTSCLYCNQLILINFRDTQTCEDNTEIKGHASKFLVKCGFVIYNKGQVSVGVRHLHHLRTEMSTCTQLLTLEPTNCAAPMSATMRGESVVGCSCRDGNLRTQKITASRGTFTGHFSECIKRTRIQVLKLDNNP